MRTGDNMKLVQEHICQALILMVLSLQVLLPESYFNVYNNDVHNGIRTLFPQKL
jgi:hypothetical protein